MPEILKHEHTDSICGESVADAKRLYYKKSNIS